MRSRYKFLKQQANTNNLARPLTSTSENNLEVWKSIWSLQIPPKFQVFLWRCSWDSLATNESLNYKGCKVEKSCSMCNSISETLEHALFLCEHSKWIWYASSLCYVPSHLGFHSFNSWWMATRDFMLANNNEDLLRLVTGQC